MDRGGHAANPSSATNLARRTVAVAALAAALVSAWVYRDAWGLGPDRAGAADSGAVAAAHPAAVHLGQPRTDQSVNTGRVLSAGPVSELDKELLVRVRQANLWELQAGRLAQTNGSSEAVKRAGLHLLDGHSRLDQIVREISAALQLPIPDEPTPEQQEWVRQLRASKGANFDQFFANQLRNAHGKVFVVVAQARSTTQNSVIRDLAIEANTAVSDHLEVLEDTGLVEPRTFDEVAKAVLK
jgi:predicted outer membrane protein